MSCSSEEIPIFTRLQEVAERHLGPLVDQRHAFGDGGQLAALLEAAGIGDVAVETVTRTLRFADGAMFVRLNTMALVGMSGAAKAMSDEARAATVTAVVHDSADVLAAFSDGAAAVFAVSSNVAIGRG